MLHAFRKFIDRYHYERELMPVYYARKFMFAFESVKFIYLLDTTGMARGEKVRGIKNMMESMQFEKEDEKQMKAYLGKAHQIAYITYKLKAYRMMYFMLRVYFELKMKKMK